MKKEECCSIFMITLMIAIPIGAVLALIFDIFGLISISREKTVYLILQDHGSFLGALLGAVVLAITVYVTLASQTRNIERQMKFQDEQTKLQIDAQSRQIQAQIDAEIANNLDNRSFYWFEQASDLMIDISELMRRSIPLELSPVMVNDSYNLYLSKINRLINLDIQLKIGENSEVRDYAKVTRLFFLIRACQSEIITIDHCRSEISRDIQPYISTDTHNIIMQCRELVKIGELKDLSESCRMLYQRSRYLNHSIADYIDEKMRSFF